MHQVFSIVNESLTLEDLIHVLLPDGSRKNVVSWSLGGDGGGGKSAGVRLRLRRNSSAKPPALVSSPVLTHIGNTCSRLDDGCDRRPCYKVGIEQVQNVPEGGRDPAAW